jgi:signal transduction histidine kinase
VFARASTRLVILFTAIIVLLVCVSGVVMYLNVKTNIAEVARSGEGGESGSESDLASRSISRLRWQLLALDGALIVTVGALGLWYARRTLRPIRELYGAQKRFVADASHELRTPLAIMKADFEVALRGESEVAAVAAAAQADELRDAVHSGLEEVDRMSAIVDDLLTLSRIDAHQEALRFAPVDLAQLVRDTAEGMRTIGARAHVTVAVTAPSGAATATADAAHLERALRNVVRNAIEHSTPGGGVSVVLIATLDEAAVRVTDQGVGIAAADLDHVFDRFYRGDSPRALDGSGTGLGLAIARWIVERHGGHITVTSTQGRGTTMALHLPLAGPR